jgi:hypothetical protein
MKKMMDGMQISLNEKEAEIIRLNMCLGDEKKKNYEGTNTGSDHRCSRRSIDSPFF